jgi:hypothetical protein
MRVTNMTNSTNATNTTTTYVLKGTDMNKGEYDFVTSCIFGNSKINSVSGEYVAHLVEVYNEVPSNERVFPQPTFDMNTVFTFNDNCTIGFFEDGEVDLCNELMMKNVSKYMSEEILLSMINEDDRELVQDYVDDGTLTIAYTAEDLHGEPTELQHTLHQAWDCVLAFGNDYSMYSGYVSQFSMTLEGEKVTVVPVSESEYMSLNDELTKLNEGAYDHLSEMEAEAAIEMEELAVETYMLYDVSLDMEQLVFVSDCLISNLEKNGTDNGSPEYVQHLKEVHQEAKEADELFLLETRLPF